MGTITQCVTGRLATIEEVVDWQPYEHIGRRLAVPEVGPVGATLDLDPVDGGTRVRLRWMCDAPDGRAGPGAGTVASIAIEKRAALERLAMLLGAAPGTAGVLEGPG